MELAAAKELAEARDWDWEAAGAKQKWRWDMSAPTDKNVDPNRTEAMKEELSAPKKWRSHSDVTPTENTVPVSETPKHSHWDQAAVTPDTPMTQIIMNALGIMCEDKLNRYLTDEELGAICQPQGTSLLLSTRLCADGCPPQVDGDAYY